MKTKKRITEQDYIKANRRASREEELRAHGRPPGYGRVHKSKKIYDRKKSKAGHKGLPFLCRWSNITFLSRVSPKL